MTAMLKGVIDRKKQRNVYRRVKTTAGGRSR